MSCEGFSPARFRSSGLACCSTSFARPRSRVTLGAMADGPKSAYELAMERLRQKDREAGVEERPLTDAQRAAIAEARQIYQAKTAEREILHRDAMRKAQSQEEVEKLESELARDRDRLAGDRDRKIAEIKQQSK